MELEENLVKQSLQRQGNDTHYFGYVMIDPPLNPSEIGAINSGFLHSATPANARLFGLHTWSDWRVDDVSLSIDGPSRALDSDWWLGFIIKNLLAPSAREWIDAHRDFNLDPRLADFTCNHTLNGQINVEGENPGDLWRMRVIDNVLRVEPATFFYGPGFTDNALEAITEIIDLVTKTEEGSTPSDPTLRAISALLPANATS